MKKVILMLLALAFPALAFAGGPIAYSSFTVTNDSALIRSATSTNTVVNTLSAVIVSSPTAGGMLKIYNSTWTTSNQVANISLATVQQYQFNDTVLKGIFYVITSNANGVTIIYKY